MNYDVVLFDADGVLVKSGEHGLSSVLEREYTVPAEKIIDFFNGPYRPLAIGEGDLREELKKAIDTWGWQGTVDELLDVWFTKATVIDEDVLALARALHGAGVRVDIATDNEKYRGEHLEKELQGKPFTEVFLSCRFGMKKSNVEFFANVWEEIGNIDKARVLFIDDKASNVNVAKEFGFDGHVYTDIESLKVTLGL